MIKAVKRLLSDGIKGQIVWAMLGLIFALAIGIYAPQLYYRYIDNRDYYQVVGDLGTDRKIYKPCDTMVIAGTSKVLAPIYVTIDIFLARQKETNTMSLQPVEFRTILHTQVPVRPNGENNQALKLQVPCDLPDGIYIPFATITYTYAERQRTVTAKAPPINITKSGDPFEQ